MSVVLALSGVAVLLLAAMLAPLAGPRRPAVFAAVYGTALAVCAGLAALGLLVLTGALAGGALRLPIGLPLTGARFALDPLAAVFLVIVDLGGAVASWYAFGYARHETAQERVLPFYPAFLAGMNLVLLAADAFGFLVSWEFMSLASWALVMSHHRDADSRQAGYVYLLMASFGTFALLLAFGLLSGPTGAYAFADMRAAAPAPWIAGAVLCLTMIGAGSKAGLAPLHVWLPLAHPAAPSHVSALMSGVMTKVAVYAFLRLVFDLAGPPAWWWAVVVLVPAAITAVLGVLHAIMESDLKRLLAYSTVENIGLVFIGLGLALAFEVSGMAGTAALAITAALFHAVNHSLFKPLLFFGAGNVLTATGERDIERLGGLIGRMPKTAYLFLGGAVAIAGLPPLNGFVSEWLMLQAVLISPELPQWGLRFLVPAAGAMLAFAAALAATAFVRAFGIVFLSRPRSDAAAAARETEPSSWRPMALLLALCLVAGTLPGLVLDRLAPVSQQLVHAAMPMQPVWPHLSIVPIAESRSSYSGLLVFLFMIGAGWAAIRVIHRYASRAVRRAPPWDCGFPDPSPATQYTASSFAQPIRRVLGPIVFRARVRGVMPPPGDASPARLELAMRDIVWDGLYAPLARAIGFAAERLNILQFLTIRSYLSLVFAALVLLLTMVATWA